MAIPSCRVCHCHLVANRPCVIIPFMPLRITNLHLPVEVPEAALRAEILQALGVRDEDLLAWRVLHKSLDARSRNNLRFVYSVVAELEDEEARRRAFVALKNVQMFAPETFDDPEPGTESLGERPVVVGSGPAGLLAGYYLAAKGYRPLIIERGEAVKARVGAIRKFDGGGAHDPENNYLFGEGGAGCFSDGKLTCRVTGPDVDWVLQKFVECGGRESLLVENRPHLGSNKLPMICRNFRRKIEALGGEYRFGCRLENLDIREGRVVGLMTSSGNIATNTVILGIGHSARDTYAMLLELGVPMSAKSFQFGLRIEQPQENIDRQIYGKDEYRNLLGAADYTLVARGQRDLFTFCMCAGGVIIPSISEPNMFCTNGMSNSRHDTPYANSGLVVTLQPHEFGGRGPLAGVELQRRYESAAFRVGGSDYLCPIQSAKDFLAGRKANSSKHLRCSYLRGTRSAHLEDVLPPSIIRAIRNGLPAMDQRWRGRFLEEAMLVGPEMRGSSPVRIDRDHASRECQGVCGLFPVGEGAGYAGGIVTAAVDGLRSARKIVARYENFESVTA